MFEQESGAQTGETIYDVIVVGAGPAGCVLASRLSEDADKTILLIDAGPDPASPGSEHTDILHPFPLIASGNAAFHWPDLTAETQALPQDGPISGAPLPYIQAHGIGGASNINGMGVDRGQPDDYDEWHALGAEGWAWNDVLPYFKKLETDLDFPQNHAHGDRGPMPVRRLPRSEWPPFSAAVAQALERGGLPFLPDYTTDFRDGFSAVPTNCVDQRRRSAAMAYLSANVRARPNLTILPDTRAVRLALAGRRASGVYVWRGERLHHLRGREVIVSCGALQSPALLLRSGLGPAGDLKRLNISVVADLPGVGQNLQNHPCIALTAYLPRAARQPANNPYFLQNWARYSSRQADCHPHDMHLMVFNKGAWHALGSRVGTLVVTVLKAYSRGEVSLSHADSLAPLTIRFNVLSDARDRARLVSGLRFASDLLNRPAVMGLHDQVFQPNGRVIASLSRPGVWNEVKANVIARLLDQGPLRRLALSSSSVPLDALIADDDTLNRFVQANTQLQFHVCGTAKMGAATDRSAVVDNLGRVRGVAGVRVADASIFPTITRGYTHFVVLMAAEKIADAIKADWAREPVATIRANGPRTDTHVHPAAVPTSLAAPHRPEAT